MVRFRRVRWVVIAFALYLIVAAIATWPLITEFDHSLPGRSTDSYVHFWNGWQVANALQNGQSPYFTHYLFYPRGLSLVYHNLAWFTIIPWLFLQLIVSGVVAYNVVFLINLALCGLAAMLLVYTVTDRKLAAFVAGIIYLAWPFRFTQLDHPNLISTYWLPVTLLFLILLVRTGRRRYGVLAGVALALVGYTRWQMLIPAAVVVASYLICVSPKWIRSQDRWLSLGIAAIMAAILLAPPAAMLAAEGRRTQNLSDDLLRDGEETVMQTDLLAYLTPGDGHPFWGDRFEAAYDRYYADRSDERRFPAYIGFAAIVLAIAGLSQRRRERLPWLLSGVLLLGLAVGPELRFAGRLYPQIPTLYRLLEPLYVVRLIRVPDRFNITLALPVAVLAGYGIAHILSRVRRPSARWIVAGVLTLIIFIDCLAIPIPRREIGISPFFEQLAREEDVSAVLNLPFDYLRAKEYMLAQITHERPIVQGKTARFPPGAFAFIDSQPWLRTLRQVSEMAPWMSDVSRQLEALAQVDIDRIILNKSFAGTDRIVHWQRYLAIEPNYDDESLAVYSTEVRFGRDFSLLRELQTGVGPVKVQMADSCFHPEDILSVDVAWGTSRALTDAYQARLALVNAAGNEVVSQLLAIYPGWPTDQWPANTLVWSYLSLELSRSLARGEYDLELSLIDVRTMRSSQTMSLGSVQIQSEACPLGLPSEAIRLDARFGNRLRLLGYEISRKSQRLQVTLYWHMMQHMERDYTVFVHVFQPDTGIPVAQDDSMPHRGAYPTRFWAAGEMVIDEIPISLSSAPEGRFELAVGVYDLASLERLPVVDGEGIIHEDGRLVLPGEIVTILSESD